MPYGIMNRIPYKLPSTTLPTGERCIQITIPDNDEWENQLYSLISAEFCRWLMWERDVGKNGTKVAARWRVALKTFKHCGTSALNSGISLGGFEMGELIDISCDSAGNCRFGYRCDVCGDFHYVQNADSPPNVTPPTPQPAPGACATFDMIVHANALYLSGVQVSTGDVITVTGLSGAWNDGGTLTWYCPTGFVYAAGICDGFLPAPVTGTDPLVASKHMILIAFDGTNYYNATAPFTINPGVALQNLTFQANDSALANNSGDVLAHVEVCKSVTPPAADGVYWASIDNVGTYPYPVWTHIPYGVLTTLTSVAGGGGDPRVQILVYWCSGGFNVHGQPNHIGSACFNLASLSFSGYSNLADHSSYVPCTACAPGSTITPTATFPLGEMAGMTIGTVTAPFTAQIVISAC